jgi:uncharacterized RDD family membrane protein YckC
MVGRDLSEHIPDAQNWEPASLGWRFAALLVDWILCLLIAAPFYDLHRVGWPPVAILVLEYGFFIGLFAQTPGMRITRLRCVGYHTGLPVGIPRALLRGVLLALFIPALIMDSQRRGLHDRAAGTIVVARPAS